MIDREDFKQFNISASRQWYWWRDIYNEVCVIGTIGKMFCVVSYQGIAGRIEYLLADGRGPVMQSLVSGKQAWIDREFIDRATKYLKAVIANFEAELSEIPNSLTIEWVDPVEANLKVNPTFKAVATCLMATEANLRCKPELKAFDTDCKKCGNKLVSAWIEDNGLWCCPCWWQKLSA